MPGMAVGFAFWAAGKVALALHREKDQGTLRRLLSAPVSRAEIIAGYILAYTALIFLQMIVLGFILAGLSGAFIFSWPPIFRAEGFMGTLARLTPHGPALEGYARLLVEQGTLADVLQPLAILLLYALLYASLASWRIRTMWR